jgi:hypothetical protein
MDALSEVDEEALPLDSPGQKVLAPGLSLASSVFKPHPPWAVILTPELVGSRDSGCLSRSRCFPTLQMAFTGVAPG